MEPNFNEMDIGMIFLNGQLTENDYMNNLKLSKQKAKKVCWKNFKSIFTRSRESTIIILAVYVDDLLIFYNNGEMQKVKEHLMFKFVMKDLGQTDFILGIKITQNMIDQIHQEKYVEKYPKTYGM